MNIRYGISSCLNTDLGRVELFDAVARAGFKYVELLSDPGHLNDWVHDPEETRRDLENHGLQALSVHSPSAGWRNNAPDEAVRRASVQAVAACLEPARAIGARTVIVHPTSSDFPFTPADFDDHLRRSVQSISELAELARNTGLRLAVENLPGRHAPRPGTTVPEVLRMIHGLGDHVGVCLDAGHSNCNGRNPAEEARLPGARFFAVHIQDNDGSGEDQHLVPGTGTTDWPALIRALNQVGYSGVRILEIPHTPEGHVATLQTLAGLVRQWSALKSE